MKTRAKLLSCDHVWNFVPAVYNGIDGKSSEVCVRRYCPKCNLEQHAYASRWYKSSIGPEGIFEDHASES